ncbi:MAG: GNAT family N-acetyltransferase, partial [Armatimonadota bacterium]|nr:GNAT family N-acetyltransferase [Armatimonadota bacterium]
FTPGRGCFTASVPCNVPVVVTFPPPRVPQLRMRFTRFETLPEVTPPEGYEIRRYLPGDEAAWAAVLNACGSLGKWDVQRVIRLLNGERHAVPEGTFFATWKGLPVATTCSVVGPGGDQWEIGWVAVHPDHQGHRLSYWTCVACLRYMRSQGATEAYLLTDDFRLPAIKTYLRLGFEPQITDESHLERWQRILSQLG